MKKLSTLFILILLLISSLSAESAKDILDKMEDAMEFETLSFSATIKNTDRMGTTTQSFDAVQNDDGDTLLTVTSGMDKGQKVLRLDDEIYIYYPDADEIIRLSDSGLSSSFLGSDFSYEDLSGDDDYEDRYKYELVGEETFNDIPCYRIKFSAKKLSETYQKMEMASHLHKATSLASQTACSFSAAVFFCHCEHPPFLALHPDKQEKTNGCLLRS